MSVFSFLENDLVTVRKADRTLIRDNVPAAIGPKVISISDTTIPICTGDIIERTLPSGPTEEFVVIDPGFSRSPVGLDGSLDRYAIKYRRVDAPSRSTSSIAFHNSVFNDNSRVNLQSVDASHNSMGATSADVARVFAAVRAVTEGIAPPVARDRIFSEVRNLEEAHGKPSFADQYLHFIGAIADHMTVFGPLLPALAALGGH